MSDFTFQWPSMLLLGLLALPLVLVLARARRARRRLMQAMGEHHRTSRALRDHLRVSAFLLIVLALARPGYAPEREAATRTGRDVVFALDVSRSMLAEDVTPSRLEVAKQGIRDALEGLDGHRVGLLVYGGSASILCPLSYDLDFVRFMLDQAHPRSVDFGGTTLQSAVEKAVDQVFMDDRRGGHDLMVLTDGEDHDSNQAAVQARLESMAVDTLVVGIGDPQLDSPIPIGEDGGASVFLEVEGQTVYTRLDSVALSELAARTERIAYFAAETRPFHLGKVYQDYAADKPAASLVLESAVSVYREGAVFFLVPALLLLFFAERWGLQGGRLVVLAGMSLAMLPAPAEAVDESFREAFRDAAQQLEDGAFAEAAERFGALSDADGDDLLGDGIRAVLEFNRGLSLVQLSEAAAADSPGEGLKHARAARDAFLTAKQLAPQMERAGIRLVATVRKIKVLEAAAEAEAQDAAVDDQATESSDEAADDSMDYEDGQPEDAGEAQSSSEMSDGDFAAGSEMQALPVPNYSAEDILLEEQGNRQFREQKRATANAGQVEKDY